MSLTLALFLIYIILFYIFGFLGHVPMCMAILVNMAFSMCVSLLAICKRHFGSLKTGLSKTLSGVNGSALKCGQRKYSFCLTMSKVCAFVSFLMSQCVVSFCFHFDWQHFITVTDNLKHFPWSPKFLNLWCNTLGNMPLSQMFFFKTVLALNYLHIIAFVYLHF